MPRGVDLISCHFIYHVSSITDSQVINLHLKRIQAFRNSYAVQHAGICQGRNENRTPSVKAYLAVLFISFAFTFKIRL